MAGPTNSVGQQILKVDVAPSPSVMSPSRVENAAFSAGPNPSVRLAVRVTDWTRLAAPRFRDSLVWVESTVPVALVHRIDRLSSPAMISCSGATIFV